MRHLYILTVFAVVLTVSLLGLRGRTFTHPPMDVFPEWAFPGMKLQPKLTQQTESRFFADGRSKQLQAVHDPRTGTAEVRRSVDDHDPAGSCAFELLEPGT